ncbi:MAG: SPW repeat protein [bacterium]
MADAQSRNFAMGRWQDGANLVLAIWLFISPWVLRFAFTSDPQSTGAATTQAIDAWVLAVIIAAMSLAALVRMQPWEEWINLLAGAWLVISPWVLGFSADRTATGNMVVVGAIVFILAVWDLVGMPQTAGRS